jgi:hypothetical protein
LEENIVKTFATPEGCHLVVENVKGKIVVQGWDQPQTEVVAVRHQEWAEVEIAQDGDKVIARTRNAHGNGGHGIGRWLSRFASGRTPTVDYTVHVPQASDVQLKNVKGPIEVQQTQGKVRVQNVDGPVTVEGGDGDVRAETVNGALRVVQCRGAADLKTVNGELDLQESTLSKLSAQTVNGNCKVAATLDEGGQYTFNTVNGNCELLLPSDFRARVSAHGVNLHVDCTQPAQSIHRQLGNWKGIIGPDQDTEPTTEITFHTVNGHLQIDNTGPAAASAAPFVAKAEPLSEPPEPPEHSEPPESVEVKVDESSPGSQATDEPQSASQLEILQRVERGEISVEKAVKLLEG